MVSCVSSLSMEDVSMQTAGDPYNFVNGTLDSSSSWTLYKQVILITSFLFYLMTLMNGIPIVVR
jgi:hypothetical protein